MNIKPTRGWALIEPLEVEEVSSGGVYMPDRVKERPPRGKVLAVGEIPIHQHPYPTPVHDDSPPCKVGDIVIFKRFVDNKVKEGDKEYLLVPFEDILAIVE